MGRQRINPDEVAGYLEKTQSHYQIPDIGEGVEGPGLLSQLMDWLLQDDSPPEPAMNHLGQPDFSTWLESANKIIIGVGLIILVIIISKLLRAIQKHRRHRRRPTVATAPDGPQLRDLQRQPDRWLQLRWRIHLQRIGEATQTPLDMAAKDHLSHQAAHDLTNLMFNPQARGHDLPALERFLAAREGGHG